MNAPLCLEVGLTFQVHNVWGTTETAQPQTLPPVATKECYQAQVLNPATGRYEWRTICK